MRALNIPTAGGQAEISDLPVPESAEGTVLIRVKAASLNAVDNVLASGTMAKMLPHHYPLVVGRDAAGVVEEVGAGVDHVAVGDEVVGHILLAPPIQTGTVAEYALLPAAAVAAKPASVDFVTAAALPLAGATALAAVDAITAEAGQTVLVVGAGGGVGSYAVQLLAARGVTVVATATPRDIERLKGLGATTVVDYTTGDLSGQVRAVHPEGVDAVIDLVSRTADGLPVDLIRKGGKVASTLRAADPQILDADGLTGINVNGGPVREVIAVLAEQVAAGALKVDVNTVLPLEKAADGLATLASRTARGKIVIKIAD